MNKPHFILGKNDFNKIYTKNPIDETSDLTPPWGYYRHEEQVIY